MAATAQHNGHRRLPRPKDNTWQLVAFAATALSVVACIITFREHAVLTYNDAISHLQISRRTIDSTSPGAAQLGGVWLPLPHVLMIPFVWNDTLYYSGAAGSVVSVIANVVAMVLIYKITYRLSGKKFAGIAAAGVYGLNVNVLYMGSTPMTESLLFALIAGMVYCVQQWADTRRHGYLIGAVVTSTLGTLTRYESWPILAALVITVVLVAASQNKHLLVRRYGTGKGKQLHRRRIVDRFILFTFLGSGGILLWLVWNQIIFGNALNFQGGDYAKPSLWLTSNEPAIGHLGIAIKTYWFAMVDNLSWPVMLLAIIGLIVLLIKEFPRPANSYRSLPIMSVLIIVPFFIASLYTGQRPLHVMQTTGDFYNVRFGLIMAIPAAIFIGYLCSVFPKRLGSAAGVIVLALSLAVGIFTVRSGNVVTYRDPYVSGKQHINVIQDETARFFEKHYTGGRVLMETFGNERLAFKAVPPSQMVYEGSYQQWEPSLKYPEANHIKWIITRCGSGPDLVCKTHKGGSVPGYHEIFRTQDGVYRVLERTKEV